MAWIMGTASPQEIGDLLSRGYEVEIVSDEREEAFFGGKRDKDEDRMVLVYLDADARDLVVAGTQAMNEK